jgi:hypothetical protein
MKKTFIEAMQRVDTLAQNLNIDVPGYRRVGEKQTPAFRSASLRLQQMLEGARIGGVDPLALKLMFRETQGTSDFPQLMGDNLWRYLLGRYTMTPTTWPMIAHRRLVNDFRTVKSIVVDGGEKHLDEVKEFAPYRESKLTDGNYNIVVKKYGRKMGFSFETFINDDLGGLRDTPDRFGIAAARSPERALTVLYSANGTFFSNTNKNLVNQANGARTDNPALTAQAVEDGLTVMRKQLDTEGEPIMVMGAVLVVPQSLDATADMIMNSTQWWLNELGGSSNTRLIVQNGLPAKIKKVVNPYLDIVGGANAAKQWYLFADPGVNRPALQVAFLRGHENPEMWVRSGDAQMIGGGLDDFANGSFDNDEIEFKVRHIYGVGLVDPKMAVTSNGTGS